MLNPKNSEAKIAGHHLYGLDMVRFFAAMLVVIYHLGFLAWASPVNRLGEILHEPAAYPSWWPFTCFGWVGVEIFFILSGFVIAYSAEKASPFNYFISRVTRLAPAMWICAAITSFVMIALGIYSPISALFLYLKSAAFSPVGPWTDGVYWTLGIEIDFYAVIFVLLCIDKLKWLHGVACGVAFASLGFWLGHLYLDHIQFFAATGHMQRTTQLLLLQDGAYFAIGIEIWLCSKQGVTAKKAAVILIGLIAGILQIISKCGMEIDMQGLGYGPAVHAMVPVVIWLLAFAAILASVKWNKKMTALLYPYARQIRLAGLATYPLYLIHDYVGCSVMMLARKAGLSALASMFSGCTIALLASLAIVAFFEPVLKVALRGILIKLGAKIHRLMPTTSFIFQPTAAITETH